MNENNNQSRPWAHPAFRNLSVALLALLVALIAAKTIGELKSLAYIGKDKPATNVITVSGKGEVVMTPDIATFSFGVTQESANVGDAQKKATDKANAILAYLKQAGVEDKDVKTSSYNIYPRYEYRNATVYNSGERFLAAYVVSQTVDVKVRDLSKAGTLLAGIGAQGATDISGLSFSIDKQDEVSRQARDKAITDARKQAEVLADALGVHLGDIVSYSESAPYQPYPMYYGRDMVMASAEKAAGSAPSIPSGENKVTSNVSITYEIR